jgi:uncharacterized protein (TIGR04255 family)
VHFRTTQSLTAVHPVLFWEKVRNDFPNVQEAIPLDVFAAEGQIEFPFPVLPPLRRLWLTASDGRSLLQVQDRIFYFNWKRPPEDSVNLDAPPYPSYDRVIVQFERRLSEFRDFLESESIKGFSYQHFELTYVNHIENANGLGAVGMFGVLVDHMKSSSPDRFLPDPDAFVWSSEYALPGNNGRLVARAQTAKHKTTGEVLVRLDLTARGRPPGEIDDRARRAWFDLAHDWITHGFADLTSPILQRDHWRRTQ